MKANRLQGYKWARLVKGSKLGIVVLCISKSIAGNYRVDVRCLDDGKVYYHWLNSDEAKRLEESGYLDTHELFEYDDLYKDGNALIKRIHSSRKYVGRVSA